METGSSAAATPCPTWPMKEKHIQLTRASPRLPSKQRDSSQKHAHRRRGPRPPAPPTSAVEQGVYDSGSSMLRNFLAGLTAHLEPGGEGWLILSDLAERLGLRTAR
jgi:hypothetical protein